MELAISIECYIYFIMDSVLSDIHKDSIYTKVGRYCSSFLIMPSTIDELDPTKVKDLVRFQVRVLYFLMFRYSMEKLIKPLKSLFI
jgi:hypothetical protein